MGLTTHLGAPVPYVTLTPDDLDAHHLCCALGDKKHEAGVAAKKAWLVERMAEGLVFRKLDVRGKVFIEYMPGEHAWRPVVAPGWLVIHCLWVSGRYQKQGHGRALLQSCVDDARAAGRHGVVVAVETKKRPFLGDRRFFEHHGFEEVDRAGAFRLLALGVGDESGPTPRFTDAVHAGQRPAAQGTFVARFDAQCPFNRHWAQQVVDDLRGAGHEATLQPVTTREEALTMASPLGTYGLERDGALACHHLTSTAATQRMLDRLPTPPGGV